jgi:hypothetical protein
MGSIEEKVQQYRAIIQAVLLAYTEIEYANGDIQNEAVFDTQRDRYLVVSVGWQGIRRVQHNLIHVDIINGKVWIQRDGTEDGIVDELEAAGIPKENLVLAFHPESDRALLPEYATT